MRAGDGGICTRHRRRLAWPNTALVQALPKMPIASLPTAEELESELRRLMTVVQTPLATAKKGNSERPQNHITGVYPCARHKPNRWAA